jgi:hypothetical protein
MVSGFENTSIITNLNEFLTSKQALARNAVLLTVLPNRLASAGCSSMDHNALDESFHLVKESARSDHAMGTNSNFGLDSLRMVFGDCKTG